MNKEKYTALELAILSFFALNSFTSTLIIPLFKGMSTVRILFSLGISFVGGFLLLKLFLSLFQDDSEERNNHKVKNCILKLLLILCASIFAIYSTFYLSQIIKEVILPGMNQLIIALVFLILCSTLAIKGMKSISIASNIMFLLYVVVILISFGFNLFEVSPINLLPIQFDINNLPWIEILFLTISPLFMLLMIQKKEITSFKRYQKYLKICYCLFYGYLCILILYLIAIFGISYFSILDYPEVNALKMIHIFNFFERLEELLIIYIFIQNFITTSLALHYIHTMVSSIHPYSSKLYIIIVLILFLFLLQIDSLPNLILIISSVIFILTNCVFAGLQKKKNR